MRRLIHFRHIPGVFAFLTLIFVSAVAPTTAQEATTFSSAVVTRNHYDPTLQHNIPNLQVTRSGATYSVNFLDHYTSTGGLTRWGYPTSEVIEEENGNLAQYYQRGVVDWHWRPDLGRYVMERRLAWDFFGGGAGGSVDQGVEEWRTNPNPGTLIGPWGHKVSDFSVEGIFVGFKGFFDALGGVQAFGFPKTDARADSNAPGTLHIRTATPGFIRQYFQAAVMEYHQGSPEPVQLTLLGDHLRDFNYPNDSWKTYAAFNASAAVTPGQLYTIQRVVPGYNASGQPVTPAPQPVQPTPSPAPTQPTPTTTTPVPTATPTPASTSVWFGSFGGGAMHYDGNTWRTYRSRLSPLPNDRVNDIHIAEDGSKWFATEDGLAQLDGSTWRQFDTGTSGFPGDNVTSVHVLGNLVWIGTADSGVGIHDIVKNTWTTLNTENSQIPANSVRDVLIINEQLNRVWIATSNGAALYNNGQWRLFDTSVLASLDVTSIGVDTMGNVNVWIGTADQGLSVYDGNTWTDYHTGNSGLTNDTIRSITQGPDGRVWIGTEGGVSVYDGSNGTWATFNDITSGLTHNAVFDVAIEASGRAWIATADGASLHDGGRWTPFQTGGQSGITYDALRAVAVE